MKDVLPLDRKAVISAYKLLADEHRLTLLLHLASAATGRLNVTEMCALLGLAQPAVSHHISLLKVGSMILPEKRQRFTFYALTPLGELMVENTRRLMGDGPSAAAKGKSA